jgi:hypothetical protein
LINTIEQPLNQFSLGHRILLLRGRGFGSSQLEYRGNNQYDEQWLHPYLLLGSQGNQTTAVADGSQDDEATLRGSRIVNVVPLPISLST